MEGGLSLCMLQAQEMLTACLPDLAKRHADQLAELAHIQLNAVAGLLHDGAVYAGHSWLQGHFLDYMGSP